MNDFNQQVFNYVDVETTGTRSANDRVIEVAVIKAKGNKILDTYSTLINPGFRPPNFILNLTGIKYEDLTISKTFEDIAEELFPFLNDGIFVAHNARFDYSFLKNEFFRSGYEFNPKVLCTVKLSRALYPHLKRHNLETLTRRLNIKLENHHRAYDDAKSLYEFIKIEKANSEQGKLEKIMNELTKTSSIPNKLKKKDIEVIPSRSGVYLFLDEKSYPVYIGMSKNMKHRVMSHFYSNLSNNKEMKISSKLEKIHYIETAGILGAQLRESQLIKQYQPIYNRKLRRNKFMACIEIQDQQDDDHGYISLKIERRKNIDPDRLDRIIGIHNSVRQAKNILSQISKEKKLCPKYLGIETRSPGKCFNYHLGLCSGACDNIISPDEFNNLLIQAFLNTRLTLWPFEGEITIVEEAETYKESFIIDKWIVKSNKLEGDYKRNQPTLETGKFDIDTYRILHSFLRNYPGST